ncbi:MAG: helix-turn-helix domain containing protein [Bacteroidetes bacterium]|nr:helix-turn-helix domain containing protein [Bacteroidota bacterium]
MAVIERRNTEKLILEAARKVFIRKGYAGSTLQEIAIEAGINKALLHYYFRSKDRLFDAIFREAFIRFIPRAGEIIFSDEDFPKKIEAFVHFYLNMLNENPHIPQFIIHELNVNPEHVIILLKELGLAYDGMIDLIEDEIIKGNIRPISPHHFLVNLFSMCVFPFVARQILQKTILTDYGDDFDRFLEERKREIPAFIINSIMVR